MLRLTSSFKNEHPRITVFQKCLWKQKALALVMPGERTPVSLSARGENCVASLFVRFFTSLLTSTQIKMTIQSEGSEAQSPPPPLPLIPFHENRKCNESKKKWSAYGCWRLCACAYMRAFLRAVNLKWFLVQERGQPWGLNFHSSPDGLSNHAFPPS